MSKSDVPLKTTAFDHGPLAFTTACPLMEDLGDEMDLELDEMIPAVAS